MERREREEAVSSALPYRDAKPVGAADFYFAINATFRFILQRLGPEALHAYWSDLGCRYFAPVAEQWRQGGGKAVADYWRAFFQAEPGAEVTVTEQEERITLDVQVCPAIRHLRANNREIVPCFCQHCFFVGDSLARQAGMALRVAGGNGSCRQTIYLRGAEAPPQHLEAIEEAQALETAGQGLRDIAP